MSAQVKRDDCRQIVIGFNRKSIEDSENSNLLRNPMFNHLLYSTIIGKGKVNAIKKQSIEQMIAEVESTDNVIKIIAAAIA